MVEIFSAFLRKILKHNICILCFVDGTSRYIRAKKTNLMHNLSSGYFITQPLYVSGVFIAHNVEVHRIYTTIGNYCSF